MLDYEIRHAHAKAYHQKGLERVANTPEPEGQKFPVGSRVKILGDASPHPRIGTGKVAVVEYVYAHAFGGDNVKSYRLNIEGNSWSWYDESQLERVSK